MKLGLATGVAREVGSSYRVLHVKYAAFVNYVLESFAKFKVFRLFSLSALFSDAVSC